MFAPRVELNGHLVLRVALHHRIITPHWDIHSPMITQFYWPNALWRLIPSRQRSWIIPIIERHERFLEHMTMYSLANYSMIRP